MGIKELDIVRVSKILNKNRAFEGTNEISRLPKIGDIGTVCHVYESEGFLQFFAVEMVNPDGLSVWLADFDGNELEKVEDMKGLNSKTENELREALTRCCGATNWVEGIVASRPFASPDDLHAKAKVVYQGLQTADYLEAFSHHPKIGGDLAKLREKFATTADWSGSEQASVNQASEEVLQRLASGNDAYYEKFGYIFIVCATGKSAQEMLDLLEARLPNDPADEIKIAAGEQEKILEIRLNKLMDEGL